MTYGELSYRAKKLYTKGEITICEYLEMTKPLDREIEQESKTGRWEWVQYDANPEIGNFHCSECRYIPASFNMSAQKLNYCPNCGAKMESEEKHDTDR